MKSKYQLLLEKHFDVGLDAEESVDLVQHLIDLDLTDQYPGFDTLSSASRPTSKCFSRSN